MYNKSLYIEIYNKELVHIVIKAERSYNLSLQAGDLRQ